MYSQTEENYLKSIFILVQRGSGGTVSTNAIAGRLSTTAASVTDMLKRLSEKDLVQYQKYKGVRLTQSGEAVAKNLVRKHRLWEVFLANQLKFSWDEVHDIAEQLEHVQSDELTERLDAFLGFPKFDPHGDPIPDSNGHIGSTHSHTLSEMQIGEQASIVGVKEHSPEFLNYLDQLHLVLGTKVTVLSQNDYDNSREVSINSGTAFSISFKVANNLFVATEDI